MPSTSIFLNPKLYPAEHVLQAAQDFSHAADVIVENGRVTLTPRDNTNPELLAAEFANYALSLIPTLR
ncbi:hypothetical protein HY642_02905 [Candidatus Woesearchaeota archaeon]|nr:hypothetical protein [Candidatus Woesearchaeota archaeon]